MNNTELPKSVFAVEVNTQAIFDTVMSERASKRQGTHKTKDRSEVRGGGRKPWAQKGTGRARAGSTRSPIWVGGGRVFGPTPQRNYTLKVNKKVRQLALTSALTLKANENNVIIDEFNLSAISTKEMVKLISEKNLSDKRRVLIISSDENVFKSSSNIKQVTVRKAASLKIEEVLLTDVIVMSSEDVKYYEGLVK